MQGGSRELEGAHVVVTGAGTGIGRAIARRLDAEGVQLSLFGRQLERLHETAAELSGQPCVDSVDIRDKAQVERGFEAAVRAHGPLHALVANAGVGGPNEAGAEDRFDELVDTNLRGSYHCARAAQARLREGQGARHIVLLSSILARIGVPGYTGYCASKAALLGLARSLAMELAPREVQVNALCPGWVDTSMAREGIEGMASAMQVSADEAHAIAMREVPLGRMSAPEDIAGMVRWLISSDARGVTGQGLDMNGGAFMS